jgi:DNA-binding phage protein
MPTTRNYSALVRRHVRADPAFRAALLREAVETLLAGDVETGKAVLRDYIKATDGFERLGRAVGTPPKSLIRMLGPRGNPQARKLFAVLGELQRRSGRRLSVRIAVDRRPRR